MERVGRCRGAVGGQAIHVVEHVEQTHHERRLRAVAELATLARDALAIVVVFRRQAQVAIALLVEPILEPAHGLGIGLDGHVAAAAAEVGLSVVLTGRRLLGHIG